MGFGPMMASLLVSARLEAPIRGTEPAPTFVPPARDTARLPPEKIEPAQPSTLSVAAMEQSIATATSTDFADKAIRQIALSK